MEDRSLMFLIGIINLIGFVYGLYYYSGQLSEWSPLFWMLIIDCPLQALLVGLIFLSSASGSQRKNNVLEFITKFTAAGSIKYGIWTMFVILFYSVYFLSGEDWPMYAGLFAAHLGLLIEGLVLSGMYKVTRRDLLLIGLAYLANDYSDYAIGTHPIVPNENLGILAVFTVFLTFLSVGMVKYYGEKGKNSVRIGFISRSLSS